MPILRSRVGEMVAPEVCRPNDGVACSQGTDGG